MKYSNLKVKYLKFKDECFLITSLSKRLVD